MDVSEVKVLAKRANGLLIVASVLMLLSGFAFVYSVFVLTKVIEPNEKLFLIIYVSNWLAGRRRFRRFRLYYHSNPEWLAFECALSYGLEFAFLFYIFIRRLSIPKVIIEYDDYGLYLYRKGMPVTLLRYEALWSVYAQQELYDVYEDFDSTASVSVKNSLFGLSSSGAIRFETPDGFIVLSGIYHVRDVEREINRMVRKNRDEFVAKMEENIEENKRKRELEELAKHDPST